MAAIVMTKESTVLMRLLKRKYMHVGHKIKRPADCNAVLTTYHMGFGWLPMSANSAGEEDIKDVGIAKPVNIKRTIQEPKKMTFLLPFL